MAQSQGNAKNILVGASPLFLSTLDSTMTGDPAYVKNMVPGTLRAGTAGKNDKVPAFASGVSQTDSTDVYGKLYL